MLLEETDAPENFRNPVLPGFHPDPSVCRVGEDYYLATSSFEWFPGVPLYHSRDLVNWKLINYALSRPSQLELPPETAPGRGIYAPTLRFHGGLFYLITTLVGRGNFLVTAPDPRRDWSDPVWIEDAPGIDPSLFWKEDGTCWYTGTCASKEKAWPHQNDIWLQRLDPRTGELSGERHILTHGHASNARWTEGPHIYKIQGNYLLITAEGGTGREHSVTAFTSTSLTGPYTPCHTNPVLSHRHLGKRAYYGMMGHADLVQTPKGEWWALLLGRRIKKGLSLLARETFLVPVDIEEGLPIFHPGVGLVPEEAPRPALPWSPISPLPERDDFSGENLALPWNWLRTPEREKYRTGKTGLTLTPGPCGLDESGRRSKGTPTMIARRIDCYDYAFRAKIEIPRENWPGEAGITLYLDYENHLALSLESGMIRLKKREGGLTSLEWEEPFHRSGIVLGVEARGFDLRFFLEDGEGIRTVLGAKQDACVITAKRFIGDGFNGPFAGLFCRSDSESHEEVIFSWCDYLRGSARDSLSI